MRHVRSVLTPLARLGLESLALSVEAREQGGKLDRGVRFERPIQVDSHKVGRNHLSQKPRTHGGGNKREHDNNGARPQHMEHHAPHARLGRGETKHIIVVKTNRMIERDLLQGFGITTRAALAVDFRLNELGAPSMAFEHRHISHVVVEQHHAIIRYERNAHIFPHERCLLIEEVDQIVTIELSFVDI